MIITAIGVLTLWFGLINLGVFIIEHKLDNIPEDNKIIIKLTIKKEIMEDNDNV